MRLVDRFTTRDGSWVPDGKEFSITPIAASKYGDCPGKGGATHIFVKSPPGTRLLFNTSDGKNPTQLVAGQGGWVNFPMFHSSAYNPDTGAPGPWNVYANDVQIATGIGLPYGWHVSTFLIVEQGDVVPAPPATADKYELYRNGVLVWHN